MNSKLYRFTNETPFFINLIREPISQYISKYYFDRLQSIVRRRKFSKEERNQVGYHLN